MTEEHDRQELDSVIEKWLDEATVMRANTELGARKSQMNSSEREEIRPPGLRRPLWHDEDRRRTLSSKLVDTGRDGGPWRVDPHTAGLDRP